MIKSFILAFIVSFFSMSLSASDNNSNPPIKKSNTGICHLKGGTYYGQTKNFTAYQSMDDCIKSGGRHPKK